MPKFSAAAHRPNRGPIRTTATPVPTYEGGRGYERTPRSELFLQAVTEMAEDTFYEAHADRRARMVATLAAVLKEPDGWTWISQLVPWLRNTANLRSAPVMLAVEAAAWRSTHPADYPSATRMTPRRLVDAACQRPDEPAEALGYWLAYHGRRIPMAVKRGIADAATRLYSERAALRYDGQSRGVRMGDVIDLTHPRPKADWQSALFRYLLDRRHNRPEPPPPILHTLALDNELTHLPAEHRRSQLEAALAAGWSWERVGGWLPGGFTAEVWEALIPTMGYMALLRNLRNFDEAGISFQAKEAVISRLADPDQVAASRQMPYRFLSAWKATGSMHWGPALEAALDCSVRNVPRLDGRTLVLIDTSGSMQSPVGGPRSQAMRWEVAALFGTVLARSANRADVVIFATDSAGLGLKPGASTLRHVEDMRNLIGKVGHGTCTWAAIERWYGGHDRVIVLTDEQAHDTQRNWGDRAWLHVINLAGYKAATAAPSPKTFTYGGFTDAMFTLIPRLEAGAVGRWPWEA